MRRLLMAAAVFCGWWAMSFQGRAGGNEAFDLIDKAVKAHFPKGEDKKNLATQSKNKGTLFVQGMELEFTQEIWVQAPKFKEVMELNVMNQAVKVSTVYNGKDAWIKANGNDVPIQKEVLEEFKQIAYAISLGQISGLKDKALKLSLLGEVQVNGKPAVGLKVSKEGKKDIDFYFDKATGLMSKVERRTIDFQSGQEITEERFITEYKDLDGRKVAKRVLVNRDGKKLLDAEVLETRFLERIDDAEFAKPN